MRIPTRALVLVPMLLLSQTALAQNYFTYGGGFQVGDCNRNNVNNPTTGTLSCPYGTSAYYAGRVLGPESRCGASQYMCLSYGYSLSNSWGFGGMYQVDDCRRNDVGNNLYNNWLACPTNFYPYAVGRIMAPESGCGAVQYACLSWRDGPQWAHPGGTFQIDDCARNNVANPFTGGTYCPSGYYARVHGRIKGPESRCGVTQYVCTQ
jgi:hypothetical protein